MEQLYEAECGIKGGTIRHLVIGTKGGIHLKCDIGTKSGTTFFRKQGRFAEIDVYEL